MRFGLGEIWSRDTGGLGQEHVSWFAQPVRQLAGLHCCSPLAGVGVGRQAPGLWPVTESTAQGAAQR